VETVGDKIQLRSEEDRLIKNVAVQSDAKIHMVLVGAGFGGLTFCKQFQWAEARFTAQIIICSSHYSIKWRRAAWLPWILPNRSVRSSPSGWTFPFKCRVETRSGADTS